MKLFNTSDVKEFPSLSFEESRNESLNLATSDSSNSDFSFIKGEKSTSDTASDSQIHVHGGDFSTESETQVNFKENKNTDELSSQDTQHTDVSKTLNDKFKENKEAEESYASILSAVDTLSNLETKIKVVEKVYFKSARTRVKNGYNIDKMAIAPSVFCYMQKDFTSTYIAELTDKLFSNKGKGQVDIEFILSMITIYEAIVKNQYPIYIYGVRYPKYAPRVVYCLNKVFNERWTMLKSIHQMFKKPGE